MKENDQSKYLRWGIPGWMMFISFIMFLTIDILLSHESDKNEIYISLQDAIKNLLPISSASAAIVALLVAAAGIPLGFLIYQVYFYIRWNSPFSRDGLFPPLVVGRWQDIKRTMRGITNEQISETQEWRESWVSDKEFAKDHGGRWRYLENYFLECAQRLSYTSGELSLYARYRYLLELLHTLGAGLFGIYLGYVGFLMVKVKIYSLSLSVMLLICALCLIVLILFIEIEDKLKRRLDKDDKENGRMDIVLDNLIEKLPIFQRINLSLIYLFFLGATLYLGSPSPSPQSSTVNQTIFRTLILIIPSIVWLLSSNKTTLLLRTFEVGMFIFVGVAASFSSQYFRLLFAPEHWAYGWATFAFLVMNTIFIKNRQNTRDDLIALQNYTLKRQIFSQKEKKAIKKKEMSKQNSA